MVSLKSNMELRDGEVHLWVARRPSPVACHASCVVRRTPPARSREPHPPPPQSPSHKFLQEVLSQYGYHGEITPDEKGKPRCWGGNGGNIEFNLSHTAGTTVVAVSCNPVGVDIESATRTPRRALEIARRFFTPAETAKLAALDPIERTEQFLRFWVRKEAMTKLDGEGILLGASDARVLDDMHGQYRGRRVWLAEFGRDLGLVGAVAAWQPFEIQIKDAILLASC